MKKSEIKVGGLYLAKVSGVVTTVRVDAIREIECWVGAANSGKKARQPRFDVTNLRTGRKTTFRSAAKFRCEASRKLPNVDAQTDGANDMIEQSDAERAESIKEASGDSDPTTTASQTEEDESCPFVEVPTTSTATTATTTEEGEQCPDPTLDVSTVPSVAQPHYVPTGTQTLPNLAARIAATRRTREPGTPVAGMVPNAEQELILDSAVEAGLRVLVVGAGAGTGKTATLKMLEQVIPGRGQYTAFNASLVAESKAKFKKCAVNTTHSLAFRAVGKQYQHRLGGERMKSYQVARILGIEPLTVTLPGAGPTNADGSPTDKVKRLSAEFLAGQVLVAVRKFCQSADPEIGAQHFHYIDGIDVPRVERQGGEKCWHNNNLVRDYLLPFCRKAWEDISRVNGELPFSHDCYVKLWQLGQGTDRPIIAADYILLDEAQDTAPVFLDILKQQDHALLVFVGDSNQAIYEWRGAVDAMKAYPDATRRLLSQSYRFGQAVADVANAILRTLDDPTDLVMRGMPTIHSIVEESDPIDSPRCYLYRTNAGAVSRVMTAIEEGKRPHLIGGGDDVVAWCQAAVDLQAKRGTRHPELCCFDTWEEVVAYSKTDEGSDLRLMVKLVTDFGAEKIRNALKNMPREEHADMVVSTAHKSKGREWDSVRLGHDFPTVNKMGDADKRLLYVAATRAKLVLDISECPPFCGGRAQGEGTGWEPGLRITYTRPAPAAEATPAPSVPAEAPPCPAAARTPPGPANGPTEVPTPPAASGNGNGRPPVTYTKLHDGSWGLRATVPIEEGQTVTVETRAGAKNAETVARVLWSGKGIWLATIRGK